MLLNRFGIKFVLFSGITCPPISIVALFCREPKMKKKKKKREREKNEKRKRKRKEKR